MDFPPCGSFCVSEFDGPKHPVPYLFDRPLFWYPPLACVPTPTLVSLRFIFCCFLFFSFEIEFRSTRPDGIFALKTNFFFYPPSFSALSCVPNSRLRPIDCVCLVCIPPQFPLQFSGLHPLFFFFSWFFPWCPEVYFPP